MAILLLVRKFGLAPVEVAALELHNFSGGLEMKGMRRVVLLLVTFSVGFWSSLSRDE